MKVFIWFLSFLPIIYAAEKYDFFQLVQQWPPTYCRVHNNIARCDSKPRFTIHGLWPSVSTGRDPRNCKGPKFNFSKINMFKEDLEINWPNLNKSSTDEQFWEYEWNVHGKCSMGKLNQTKYFNSTLTWKREVDLLYYLEKEKIVPTPVDDNTLYSRYQISEAIQRGTKYTPRLWCNAKLSNVLLEISVCINASAEPAPKFTDCPSLVNRGNICTENVSFPIQSIKPANYAKEEL